MRETASWSVRSMEKRADRSRTTFGFCHSQFPRISLARSRARICREVLFLEFSSEFSVSLAERRKDSHWCNTLAESGGWLCRRFRRGRSLPRKRCWSWVISALQRITRTDRQSWHAQNRFENGRCSPRVPESWRARSKITFADRK